MRVLGCDVGETRLMEIKAGQAELLAADHDRLGRFAGAGELVLTTEPAAPRPPRDDGEYLCPTHASMSPQIL